MTIQPSLFISYGRRDGGVFATDLYNRLTDAGIQVWFDKERIPPAVSFQQEISVGISKADNFLFIMTPHAVNSDYCRGEIERAVHYGKRIIPILLLPAHTRQSYEQLYGPQTDDEWLAIEHRGYHRGDDQNPNLPPIIQKLNWLSFEGGFQGSHAQGSLQTLLDTLNRDRPYVRQHTDLLIQAMDWDTRNRPVSALLVGDERKAAEAWLHQTDFEGAQPPCHPTDLQCEFIGESIKNANNLMTQVFLAHAEADAPLMEQVRRSLLRAGITVWSSKTDIPTGTPFQEAIQQGIEGADILLYLLSPDALQSKYCQMELDYAISLNKRIIPLRLTPLTTDILPPALRGLQYLNLADNVLETHYRQDESQLLQALRQDSTYYNQHKILLTQALKWERQDRNPSILLRGYNLRQAEIWLQTGQQRSQQRPLPIQDAFITESLRQPPSSLDVFIAYSRTDADFARRLNDALQTQGKRTWFDQESIASGTDFQQEIYRGIENSDNIIFILSPRSITSPHCANEVEYAVGLGKRLIPVHYRSVDSNTVHPELAKIQWVDFREFHTHFPIRFNQLLRVLETDREYIHSHTRWSQRALEWEQKNRSDDWLLRGNELAIAEVWITDGTQTNKKPPPTSLQVAFIEASQALRDRLEHQAEAQRQQQLRQAKRTALGALGGGMVMMGLALFALVQWAIAIAAQFEVAVVSAEARWQENDALDDLDTLIQALNITRRFYQLPIRDNDQQQRVTSLLQQAVYGIRERDRLVGQPNLGNPSSIPDGPKLITVGNDGTAYLWNFQGQQLAALQSNNRWFTSASLSPDEQYLATTEDDGAIRVRTLQGTEVAEFVDHQGTPRSVNFSPDGRQLASAGDDGKVYIWDLASKTLTTQLGDHEMGGHQGPIYTVFFSHNNQQLITTGDDRTARLWSLTGKLLATFEGHQDIVWNASLHPNPSLHPKATYLATASADGKASLWTRDGQHIRDFLGHQGSVNDVSFSPNGTRLATVGEDGTVRLWTLAGEQLAVFVGHQGSILNVQFSQDGWLLATTGSDGTTRLWDLQGSQFVSLNGHEGWVLSSAFNPDGYALASAGKDGNVMIWERYGEYDWQLNQKFPSKQGEIRSVQFNQDGQRLATAGNDGSLRVWTRQGQPVGMFSGHEGRVSCLDFSPNGRYVATGGLDGTVRMWRVDGTVNGRVAAPPEFVAQGAHVGEVNGLSFSPDGQWIVTAGNDGNVRLWNLQGEMVLEFRGHQHWVWSIQFSPNGKYLATAGQDGIARVWHVDSVANLIKEKKRVSTQDVQNLQVTELIGHSSRIRSLEFSPDSQILVTAGSDDIARLWDLQTQQLLAEFRADQGGLWNATFSPDGRWLATSGSDGTTKLWLLGKTLEHLRIQGCQWILPYLERTSTASQQASHQALQKSCRKITNPTNPTNSK